MRISNYDEFDYDYKEYWKEREYEDVAERMALEKLLGDIKVKTFLDIGGSFGRLTDLYYDRCETPIIVDYSLKTLQKYQKQIHEKFPNTVLIAANAYKLPFKNSSIDASICIRVMHHLEKSDDFFSEVNRVTRENGFFFLEFANKMHLKARIRWITSFQFQNFSLKPYQQPSLNYEGSKEGKDEVFLNYHPRFVKDSLKKNGFEVFKKKNCSFLRISFLKKRFSPYKLLKAEKLLQNLLGWTNIGPSLMVGSRKSRPHAKSVACETNKLFTQCVKCCGNLEISDQKAVCKSCETIFLKKNGIWDFRI